MSREDFEPKYTTEEIGALYPKSILSGDIFEVVWDYRSPTYNTSAYTSKADVNIEGKTGIMFFGEASPELKTHKMQYAKAINKPDIGIEKLSMKQILFFFNDTTFDGPEDNYKIIEDINYEEEARANNTKLVSERENIAINKRKYINKNPDVIMGYWFIEHKIIKYNFPIWAIRKINK